MVARFIDRASRDPERRVFCTFPLGAMKPLQTITWGDWIRASRGLAGALCALHVERGTRVAVLSENRTLWPITVMGAFFAGCTVVAIHPDASAEQIVAQLNTACVRVLVVDTLTRFKLVRTLQAQLLGPLVIACDDLEPLRTSVAEDIFEFEGWCRAGEKALRDFPLLDARLRERIDAVSPSDTAVVFFPEDAAGDAMLMTHRALLASTAALAERLKLSYRDHTACYRSFSDPAEQLLGIHATVLVGSETGLVEHEADAFTAARQFETTVLSVASRALGVIRDTLADGRADGTYLRDKVCALLGRHCRVVLWDHEPVSPEFVDNLRDGSISAASIFGTSEQACVLFNGPHTFDASALGTPLPGVETRLSRRGELEIFRGALTFARTTRTSVGTTTVPIATDQPEWLSTGVRAEALPSGAYRQVGNMDDLLQLVNGVAVSTTDIERALGALPLVARAVCETDEADTLVAVLSLDRHATEQWADVRGLRLPWDALVLHPLVYEELALGIAQVNARLQGELGSSVHIAAFLPTDLAFSQQSGELTHDLALNRSVVTHRFRHVFADLRRGLQS